MAGGGPHDADPLHGCLPTACSTVATRPRAGLASADVGDGLTPVVDRYFGGIPAPATVEDGWEPAGFPHGTLMVARRECLQRWACSTSATSRTARRPSWRSGPRPGWEIGVVRGAEVRNTGPRIASAVVDYLQPRNTLLLVREHSGRYHVSIRLVIAVWHLLAGAVSPRFRGARTGRPGHVCSPSPTTCGTATAPPPAAFPSRRSGLITAAGTGVGSACPANPVCLGSLAATSGRTRTR